MNLPCCQLIWFKDQILKNYSLEAMTIELRRGRRRIRRPLRIPRLMTLRVAMKSPRKRLRVGVDDKIGVTVERCERGC